MLPEWAGGVAQKLAAATWLAALGGLLTTGAVGYLTSVVHHIVHWRGDRGVIDHRPLIKRLVRDRILDLYEPGSSSPLSIEEVEALKRDDAWVITSALWHQRIKRSRRIEGADAKATALVDHAHSTGTSRVAAALALLTAICVAPVVSEWVWSFEPVARYVGTLAVGAGLWGIFQHSHKATGAFAQQVIDEILADALKAETLRKGALPSVATHIVVSQRQPSLPVRLFGGPKRLFAKIWLKVRRLPRQDQQKSPMTRDPSQRLPPN